MKKDKQKGSDDRFDPASIAAGALLGVSIGQFLNSLSKEKIDKSLHDEEREIDEYGAVEDCLCRKCTLKRSTKTKLEYLETAAFNVKRTEFKQLMIHTATIGNEKFVKMDDVISFLSNERKPNTNVSYKDVIDNITELFYTLR